MRADPPGREAAITPAGVFLEAALLLLSLWFTVPWLYGSIGASASRWRGVPPPEARAELRAVRSRLGGEAQGMDRYFPEGQLLSWSFYGFALVNMSLGAPGDAAFRAAALRDLERVIAAVERVAQEWPLVVPARSPGLRGGIIPAAQANLLRAGYLLLGGGDRAVAQRFHRESASLHAEFMRSPTGSLESYAGRTWPVDNVCALVSLEVHDRLFKTAYAEAAGRWTRWMEEHLDPETGMMPAEIGREGRTVGPPRGCALSWSLAFLPNVAPSFAASQYKSYRENWFVHVAGTTGIREWPPGHDEPSDPDSGPVVAGIGPAASAFGIAAAAIHGDRGNMTGMLRGLELTCLPYWNWRGEKHYLGGQVILADVLALWAKTNRPWVMAPGMREGEASAADRPGFPWFGLAVLPFALGMACVWTRRLWRQARSLRRDPSRREPVCLWVLAGDAVVLSAWLVFPRFTWLAAVSLLLVLHLAQRRGLVPTE